MTVFDIKNFSLRSLIRDVYFDVIFEITSKLAGIDTLISSALTVNIKKRLGKDLKKFERKLFQKHGMSIKQSIENFQKFDNVLEGFYATESQTFEKKCVNAVISFKKYQKDFFKIAIKEENLARLLLTSWSDVEKQAILNSVLEKPQTIPEILDDCGLPKTSGYRIIESLIREGLLVIDGVHLREGKRLTKYKMVYDSLTFNISKDNVKVVGLVRKKYVDGSSVIQTIS